MVNDFHAYGDQLLNGYPEYNSISDMASDGCTITLSFKADQSCTYSWSKTYTNSDSELSGECFYDAQIPYASNYKTTIKIESGCVRDNYLGLNVKFVWKKTIKSSDYDADADMGFPQKEICPNQGLTNLRPEIIDRYVESGRISSSSIR